MQLAEFYPSPKDLIQSEVSILEYLRGNRYIKEKHPQFAVDAENYYARYKDSRSGFEFHSYFDVWHAPVKGRLKPNARLTLSARIELEGRKLTNVSYCLSVCRIQSTDPRARMTILRKFHFDVTVATTQQRRQEHPQCHLQYCGEMVPYMTTIGCRANQLDQMHPSLSEPRILFSPMSLGLLIDMALHEFPDQNSAKFREDSYWRGLLRKQEDLILRPFYEKCVEVIKNTNRENRTLADAFYIT